MCGGVGFKIKNIPEKELKKHYSKELIKRFKTSGRIETFFWYKNPVLPVKDKDEIELIHWGNKDKEIKLPQTGWAKQESLNLGKWDYLHPEIVDVPIDSGYEKKTWFDMPNGTKGIVVEQNKEKCVYMMTKEASQEYKKETGHDREPLGEKENYEHELGKQDKLV
jgi:hypothetical protein